MNFIDRMFLMWHSKEELAAALPAGMVHFSMICIPLGIALYVSTFVAQLNGAKRDKEIGGVVWLGVFLGLIATPLFLVAIPIAPYLFQAIGHELPVAGLETEYFQALTFGAGGAVVCSALASFFTGRGDTRTVMYANFVQAILNIALDYCWIFGHFGFPEMGIAGAGWATIVSIWAKAIFYAIMVARPKFWRPFGFDQGWRLDLALIGRMVRFGGPNGVQMLLDSSAFTIFVMFVGMIGTNALAASTIAINVFTVAFVPMIGLGISVTTLVGRHQGAGQSELASRATWSAVFLSTTYTGVFSVFYLLAPDVFLSAFSAGSSAEQFVAVRPEAIQFLRFVAAFSIFNAMSLMFVSGVKGAGDTHFVLKTSLVMAIALIGFSWLAVMQFNLGVFALWWILTLWICVIGMIYLMRFVQGRWRNMSVIELETAE